MSDTITVIGNITEPELRQTNGGVPVVSFRIASTQRRYDRAEEKWVDGATNWFGVSAFRGLGEHAFRSLRKGDRVIVTGRLRLKDWETGAKKGLSVEIEADAIGHDLLWGTTTFHRGGSSVAEPPVVAGDASTWQTATPGAGGGAPDWGALSTTAGPNEERGEAETDADSALTLAGAAADAPF